MVIPFLQAIIGDMISVMAVVAVLAGIYKVFQMAASLNEIKDLLADIKRNTHDISSPAPEGASWSESEADSTESLRHAVDSQSGEDQQAQPSLLEP